MQYGLCKDERMPRRVLCQRRLKTLKPRIIATFDIETDGLGGTFLEAAIYDGEEVTYFATASEMMMYMSQNPKKTYYAHNGANYDFHYLLESLYDFLALGWTIEFQHQGEKIIAATCKRDKVSFRLADSFPLLSTSLAKASKAFAPKYMKKDIGLGRGVTYDPMNPVHKEYLAYDVMGLYWVMQNFRERVFGLFGCDIGLTAGSTAMKCFLATMPTGHVHWRLHRDQERFCRDGYFGGYTYPGLDMNPHPDILSVDINAAYAAVMKEEYPVGIAISTAEYHSEYFGIYRCRVTTPPYDTLKFPCIPYRDPHGPKTCWAAGTFETTITNIEIEFARKRGYVIDVIVGYYWLKKEKVFINFVNLCESLELESNEHKEVTKIMRNSLYGKFGTRLETQRMILCDQLQDGMYPVIDPITGMPIEHLAMVDETIDEPYVQPHWAVFVTARERLRLIESMEAIGHQYVRYGDTDSIKADRVAIEAAIERGDIKISKRFGDFKQDGAYDMFQVFGPKNYRYTCKGKNSWKVKGIPAYALLDMTSFDPYKDCVIPLLAEVDMNTVDPRNEPIIPEFQGLHSFRTRIKKPSLPIYSSRKRTVGTMKTALTWQLCNHKIYPLVIAA
jgi:hypothetical protein